MLIIFVKLRLPSATKSITYQPDRGLQISYCWKNFIFALKSKKKTTILKNFC